MPITFAPLDKELTIIKVSADIKTKKHLEDLGILQNSKITVIASDHGNIICLVKGIKLALNKDVAKKIFVA